MVYRQRRKTSLWQSSFEKALALELTYNLEAGSSPTIIAANDGIILFFFKSEIFNDKSSLILRETGFPLRMIVSKINF